MYKKKAKVRGVYSILPFVYTKGKKKELMMMIKLWHPLSANTVVSNLHIFAYYCCPSFANDKLRLMCVIFV